MGAIAGIINFKENMYIYGTCNKIIVKAMAESYMFRNDMEIDDEVGENFAFSYIKSSQDKSDSFMKKTVAGYEFSVVFDGELYNKEELKKHLEKKGYEFIFGNDLEILLYTYIHYGEKVTKMLNGVYSFCIWDSMRQQAFLCRDRLGIKPLYYVKKDDNIIFSSEIKALFNYTDIVPQIEKSALLDFFAFSPLRCDGDVIFKSIKELKPAHTITINRAGIKTEKYWDFDDFKSDENECNSHEKFHELLEDAIDKRVSLNNEFYTIVDNTKGSILVNSLSEKNALKSGKIKLSYSFDSDVIDNNTLLRHGIINPFDNGKIEYFDEFVSNKDTQGNTYQNIFYLNGLSKIKKSNSVIISCVGMDRWISSLFSKHCKSFLDVPLYSDFSVYKTALIPMVEKTLDISAYFEEKMRDLTKNNTVRYINFKRIISGVCDIQYNTLKFLGHSLRNPLLDYRLFEYLWWMAKMEYKNPFGDEEYLCKEKETDQYYLDMTLKKLLKILEEDNAPVLAFFDKQNIIKLLIENKNLKNSYTKSEMTTLQLAEQIIWLNEVLIKYKPHLV